MPNIILLRPSRPGALALVLLALCWDVFAGTAAAVPQITNLSLHGLQTGGATTLTIDGADLLPNPRVVLPVPTAAQVVKDGATANRVQIEVKLPAEVPPGLYPLRLATAKGISNSILIGVDDLAQVPFAAQVAALPAALHGNLAESDTLLTTFPGRKGQRLVVDIEARRLGSALDPVIDLYDPRHVQVAFSQGKSTLHGDARLEANLPADGPYTVELHDLLYRAGSPNHFRLKIGTLAYADLVYPLGGRRGTEASFEVIGNMYPAGTRVSVDLRQAAGDLPFPLPARLGVIGPAPRLVVGDFAEVLKTAAPAGKLQEVTAPAVINGRIEKPQEEDRYRLLVKPGMKLRFDVWANRAGAPLDGTLSIRNEEGATLAESDDQPDTVDPGLEFTVPGGVNALVVALRDVEGRGGPEYVYRLAVTPADHPDFRLEVLEDRFLVPRDGVAVVRVHAERTGYNGPIKLSLVGLPAGLTVSGQEIPAGATDTLLSLAAPAGTAPAQGLFKIIGDSADPQTPLRRTVLLPSSPVTQTQPWLRSDLGLAVVEPGSIRIAWETQDPFFAVGSTYPARVRLTRAAGATGPVRLSLLTSQVVPKTPDGMREDRNRALRFADTPMIAANQTAGVANVLVPGDLPALPYDLAVQAELLGNDGRTVLATALTPARRLLASQPFTLELAGPAAVQARSGSGPTGKLTGKIVRAGGFDRPVTVSLTGLPPELPPPQVTVPAGRSDFELPVAFPYETKLGPLANVKLVATSPVSSQRVFTSNEFPVAVQVVKGDPPPPPPALYRVFEDEPNFVALLYEGDGQAALETVDRYAGSAALRVTGAQRFRTKMPGWGYKIAEKPGAGEFRYLRFAWKKRGGGNIVLQLNANGKWGPLRGSPGPSFRYEAGPTENSFQVAAVKVDARLPDDWVVVTRDLFADFGPFALTGIAFTPGPGEYGLFDHVYLARSLDDFKGCPAPRPPEQPRLVFEDQPQFLQNLLEGAGTATLDPTDKYSGKVSLKVTPDQRFNERMPGLGVKIRQNPGFSEYRFLRFAWKKKGGQTICLQLNHDGEWGPTAAAAGKFRYHAGPGGECYGASLTVDDKLPNDWVVVTRDLYADFGEFTWTGIAFSPVDGEYALFDHIYLGKTSRDFELVKPKPAGVAK